MLVLKSQEEPKTRHTFSCNTQLHVLHLCIYFSNWLSFFYIKMPSNCLALKALCLFNIKQTHITLGYLVLIVLINSCKFASHSLKGVFFLSLVKPLQHESWLYLNVIFIPAPYYYTVAWFEHVQNERQKSIH